MSLLLITYIRVNMALSKKVIYAHFYSGLRIFNFYLFIFDIICELVNIIEYLPNEI